MADPFDEYSQRVVELLRHAGDQLKEAEHIFETETTDQHRQQWPNVYRLEHASRHAQEVLALVDPRIVSEAAAQAMASAATQARTVIHEAVTTGGGSLIDAAEGLLKATQELEVGVAPPDVPGLRRLREELANAKEEINAQIKEAAAEVSGQKDQAFAAIKKATDAVEVRKEAAEQQARELGLEGSAIAAENLAQAYGTVAKETEEQAASYTRWSFLTYLFSILVAGAGIYFSAQHTSQVEDFVARAAVGIPFALLGAYITSLASTHRREAWRLRHIELQIKTANPFLGLLEVGRREETLAALAIRFFPGQEGVSFEKGGQESSPELLSLLRQLVIQQSTGGSHGPSPQPTAQPASP